MTTLFMTFRRSAVAATAILPFIAFPLAAQTTEQATDTDAPQQQTAAQDGAQEDSVVARVGAVDIRTSDVMRQIGLLPDRFRAQPPEMLIPIAIEQLVLRQLILQEASTQELGTDAEVQARAEEAARTARENVLVETWLQRRLDERVTPEAIQSSYDAMQSKSEAELPPLEQVRGQIEQSLRQQEVGALTQELLESDGVVLYGPDGQPVSSQVMGGEDGSDDDTDSQQGSAAAASQSADDASDTDAGSDAETDADGSGGESQNSD